MTTVILAEKPSQAKAYVDSLARATKHAGYYAVSDPILPNETFVTYGFGHLVELVTPDKYDVKYKRWALNNLPIFPEHYKYTVPADKQAQFKIVKELLTKAQTIIVATDADREGENIAWSIMVHAKVNFKNTEIKRLWINSLEPAAIRNGLINLKPGWDYYPKYLEAQTREISDWLVGMNASPLYTLLLKQYGIDETFSVGRVQTPTLEIVHERQATIENFVPERYLQLEALITTKTKLAFKAKLHPDLKFRDDDQLMAFMNSKHLNAGPQYGEVVDITTTPKVVPSPRLFSLSSLQSQANRLFKVSASATLKAVQNLYEAKLLTYPRTDSNYITNNEFNYLKEHLGQYKQFLNTSIATPNMQPQSRYVNGAKVQEHHAIIVTRTIPTAQSFAKLGRLEQQIYLLVLRTTVAMFASGYMYDETVLVLKIAAAEFKKIGRIENQRGWKELFGNDKKPDDEDDLPKLAIGELVDADVMAVEKFTQPPELLTEGTLITAMKRAGKLVDDTQEQAILKETEGIGTEATRANIIDKLKVKKYLTVEQNNLTVSPAGQILCQAVASQPLLVSPELTAKWEVALQQISQQTRTPENFLKQIKHFVSDIITNTPARLANDQVLQKQIELYKQTLVKQSTQAVLGQCPRCQIGLITDKGKFYGCSNYATSDEGCRFTLPKRWSGKQIPAGALQNLLQGQETQVLKGFKSKAGNSFSAKLKMTDDKLTFVFTDNKAKV